jgi:pilus assembly protein CpaB
MNRRWVIPIFAAALAVVTTLAILSYLQALRRPAAVVPQVRTEAVVFAKTDIAQRRVINPDQLELRQVPFTAVHPRAARQLQDVANRVALAPIFADQQVLSTMVAPPGVNAGLSYVLPKDMRAMTIPVNEVVDVAGFVFPGDRVDIIGTVSVRDNNLSKIFLQNVMVLAVAQKVDQRPGEEPKVTSSATVAVTPDQAETLAQIDNTGKLRLALRPTGVTQEVETTGKTTEAALGSRPMVPVVSAAAAPSAPPRASAPRVGLPIVLGFGPAVDRTVELWRGTEKSTVHF